MSEKALKKIAKNKFHERGMKDRRNKTLGKKLRDYGNVSDKRIKKNAKYLVENDSPYHDIRKNIVLRKKRNKN